MLGAGTVVVSGFTGFHQLCFNRTEDEIFVGTNNEGMRRFKLVGSTWTEQLPQLIGGPNWIRGVAVSPDGKRLYASSAGSIILQWDLTNNMRLADIPLQDSSAQLHFMTICGPAKGNFTVGCSPAKLFVSDSHQTGPRAIYSYDIDNSDNLINGTKIDSDPTFSVALSPDSKELFSGESAMNLIQRFKPMGNTWMPEATKITTQNTIGTILIFPDNAVPVPPN
jgi:WD40 repeat protein